MVDISSGNQKINIAVSSTGNKGNVSTSPDMSMFYTERSKEWAISDKIVNNEDYSSKYYAQKSKEQAQISTEKTEEVVNSGNAAINNINTAENGAITNIVNQEVLSIENVNNTGISQINNIKTEGSKQVTLATNQANIATEKANIATTQAGIATAKTTEVVESGNIALSNIATAKSNALNEINATVDNAEQYAQNALTSANNAALSESNALSYKNSIQESAQTATEQANIAVTNANKAITSATNAKTSETNAKSSETRCEEILSRLGTAIKIKGRVDSVGDLPLSGNLDGDAYLVGEEGLDSYPEYYWYQDHWEFLGTSGGGGTWGTITGNITAQSDLIEKFDTKQDKLTSANAGDNITITEATAGNALPEGYTQLEYIETDGKAYIDTGIVIPIVTADKQKYKFEYKGVMSKNSTLSTYALDGVGGGATGFYVGISNDGKFGYYGIQDETIGDVVVANVPHVFMIDYVNRYASLDGVTQVTGIIPREGTYVQTLGVFCYNSTNKGSGIQQGAKRYWSKLWKDGSIILDLIPAKRNLDNVLGMYDTITGKFYTNASTTGSFIAGGVVGGGEGGLPTTLKISANVPTKTSQLTNDSDFITSSYHDSTKQDTLVSGENIKTLNNESILGSGNLDIDGLPSQEGNEGKFLTTNGTVPSWEEIKQGGYHPDIFSIKWSDHIINDIQWLRADTFSWQSGDIYTTAYNTLLDEYNTGIEETEDDITFVRSANGFKIADATQEANILAKYNTDGIAWYYILDTDNKRFKLPRTKFGFEGVRDTVGNDIDESLPNIRGDYTYIIAGTPSGAFYRNTAYNANTAYTNSINGTLSFDASLSSSSYQDNAPVQERSTQMYLYFYVGEYTREAIEQTAGITSEQLNGKVDVDSLQEINPMIESFVYGTSGYNIWANGYCEQWGAKVSASPSWKTISLFKTYKDKNYLVTTSCNGNVNGTSYWTSLTNGQAYTTNSIQILGVNADSNWLISWKTCGYLAEGEYTPKAIKGVQQ